MAKERKPIATRTRNRTKSQDDNNNSLLSSTPSPTIVVTNKETKSNTKKFSTKIDKAKHKKNRKRKDNDQDKEDESPSAFRDLSFQLPYLPKSNFDIYLQELHQLPSSFIRGTTAEKRRDILRNDQDDYYNMSHLSPDSITTKYTKKKPFFISDDMALDGKHTEYSICLHRAFIKKRYLSDQECIYLAKYVNCDFYTQSLQELAMLIKDELYMYRIDFTERHLHHIRTMNITEEVFLENEKGLEKTLEEQLSEEYLRYFWGSWIIEPFTDPDSFFSISENKDLLAKITAKTLIEHLKYFFNIISTKKLDEELRKIDKISIAIILPS